MTESQINSLEDLSTLRTAPNLDNQQSKRLLDELCIYMDSADWFTIGIMASSANIAVSTFKEMETRFNWSQMNSTSLPKENGPVFLKANQKTGDIYVRIEHGLGEGVLISCQHNDTNKNSETFGPFPLNFFQ